MGKAQKQPYVRFFASDWLGGTRGMKASEVGVYITLIAMMYERCEPLPEDHKRLSRQCGCAASTFTTILEMLIEDGKITREESGLWNARVEKEFKWREKNSQQSSEAAHVRWEKAKENNSDEMPAQCERNASGMPSQKPETRSQKPEKKVLEARASRLPSDWQPTDENWSFALGEGMTVPDIETEAAKFRDYWTAKGGKDGRKLDWDATWRNWIRNRRTAKRPGTGTSPDTRARENHLVGIQQALAARRG